MGIYLTADQHFGHHNIIAYSGRPFANVDEMIRGLVARHNAVVTSSDDTVIHVGDFSLQEKWVPEILPLLRGRHRLVPGNHDGCHPRHRGSGPATRRYLLWGFESVAAELHLDGFLISHMPYRGDHTPVDRYERWRPIDKGEWLLHGHVHEKWRVRGRMINVGVDQWAYAPVLLEALQAIRERGGA